MGSESRSLRLTARGPGEHEAVEYESGWYVQKPDDTKPLEFACYITVAGPYKTQQGAERKASALNHSSAGGSPNRRAHGDAEADASGGTK